MNPSTEVAVPKFNFKYFKSPKTVIGRFVIRNSIKSAALWALVFGIYVASKAGGYALAYPTIASRTKFAASFANNIGFNAILGTPHDIGTVGGLTVWNCLLVIVIIGAIWAFLKATKTLRGEENAGRWELLLSGQTTAKTACINALAGLSVSLIIMYLVMAVTFVIIGKVHSIGFSVSASLFFALASVSGAAIFMAIGAFMAELFPTRSRAAGYSAAIFGASFLVRAAADSTHAHWLLNITPLGWIEKLQPLTSSQPIWLLPIIALILILGVATVWLANNRDLGDSIFADKDISKPHNILLNSPIGLTLRLVRGITISWLIGIFAVAVFYALLTKAATNIFSSSSSLDKAFRNAGNLQQVNFELVWLGVVFYLLMLLIMAYVASAIGAVREDEAVGYVDNLIVCPVSRLRWLGSRIAVILLVIIGAGLVAALGTWLGLLGQHIEIAFHELVVAGLNVIIPAVFILSLGIFAIGFLPRLTTVIAYSAIAWSFLISILKSGVNLNHWILDTSILQHVALSPAVSPTWRTSLGIILVSLVLAGLGIIRFNGRDLQSE